MIPCPICGASGEPAERIGDVAVCAACGSSLVIEATGTVRRATAADTEPLSGSALARLVHARSRIARQDRRRG